MAKLPKKLQQKLQDRAAINALRELSRPNGLVDFSSNDYLGFSKSKTLFEQTTAVLTKRGIVQNGATGSRLLSGNHELYEELELKIASFHMAESALVFNSGYDANCGFFGSVPQRGDIIFYDEFAHASIRDGIKLGNAKSYKFKHNDLNDLKEKYQIEQGRSSKEAEFYIVTESVFSMDGDSPDLKAFADFSIANNCHFVVDEAHSIGVFGTDGAGLVQQLGLEQKVFARIITFGKALGCHGAAVLGSTSVKSYLVNFARSFIYTTGLPPHSVAAILAAYEFALTQEGLEKRQLLQKNIRHFNLELAGLLAGKLVLNPEPHFIPSESAIHCCVISGNDKVKAIANQLQESRFDVRPILSPTVPKGRERLRFCIHSYNSTEEITTVLSRLFEIMQQS